MVGVAFAFVRDNDGAIESGTARRFREASGSDFASAFLDVAWNVLPLGPVNVEGFFYSVVCVWGGYRRPSPFYYATFFPIRRR